MIINLFTQLNGNPQTGGSWSYIGNNSIMDIEINGVASQFFINEIIMGGTDTPIFEIQSNQNPEGEYLFEYTVGECSSIVTLNLIDGDIEISGCNVSSLPCNCNCNTYPINSTNKLYPLIQNLINGTSTSEEITYYWLIVPPGIQWTTTTTSTSQTWGPSSDFNENNGGLELQRQCTENVFALYKQFWECLYSGLTINYEYVEVPSNWNDLTLSEKFSWRAANFPDGYDIRIYMRWNIDAYASTPDGGKAHGSIVFDSLGINGEAIAADCVSGYIPMNPNKYSYSLILLHEIAHMHGIKHMSTCYCGDLNPISNNPMYDNRMSGGPGGGLLPPKGVSICEEQQYEKVNPGGGMILIHQKWCANNILNLCQIRCCLKQLYENPNSCPNC